MAAAMIESYLGRPLEASERLASIGTEGMPPMFRAQRGILLSLLLGKAKETSKAQSVLQELAQDMEESLADTVLIHPVWKALRTTPSTLPQENMVLLQQGLEPFEGYQRNKVLPVLGYFLLDVLEGGVKVDESRFKGIVLQQLSQDFGSAPPSDVQLRRSDQSSPTAQAAVAGTLAPIRHYTPEGKPVIVERARRIGP